MFNSTAEQYEKELMKIFERIKALDQATKKRIGSKIWARVKEDAAHQPLSEYMGAALVSCGTILGSFLTAVALAIMWPQQPATLVRLGALAVALLTWACGLILVVWLDRIPWILTIAASAVMGIRILPSTSAFIPYWTATGLRSGFFGILVVISGLILGRITEPIFKGIADRKRSSKHPEAAIVTDLLRLIDQLENLETARQQRDQLLLAMYARKQRSSAVLGSLSEDDTRVRRVTIDLDGPHPEGYASEVQRDNFPSKTIADDLAASGEQEDDYSTRYKISVQQADGSWKIAALESTGINRQEDQTFLDNYKFEILREDESLETMISETLVSPTYYFFDDDPKLRTMRQDLARLIEELARHVEQGLSAKLSVGEQQLDTWLRQELQGRAQTIRGWGQRIALPSESSYENLLSQVVTIVEHAVEEQWAAIPKSEESKPERPLYKVLRFARNAGAPAFALLVVLVAPVIGIPIPLTIRDPVLTFAIPWILLQVLEFIAPNSSESLSRSKDLRELIGKSFVRT